MRERFKKSVAILALTVGLNAPVNAEFIDYGSYFTDTTSMLDWLDVAATVNQSYDAVSAQFETGGRFSGWRYATAKEFNQMISNYTSQVVKSNLRVDHSRNAVDGLIKMLGSTYRSDGNTKKNLLTYTNGILEDQLGELLARNIALILDDDRTRSGAHYTMAFYTVGYDNDRWDTIGSYLVRKTESTTIK